MWSSKLKIVFFIYLFIYLVAFIFLFSREKLGLSQDDEVSIEEVRLRHQKEAEIKRELKKRNELLEQENFDLKSDVSL